MSNLNGTYRARAVEWDLGFTSTGKEQVMIRFEVFHDDEPSDHINYYGFFTEKTAKRTMETLRLLGWEGDDPTKLEGLDANEVDLVIEPEEYEGKWTSKVKWVNRPGGGGLKNEKPMDEAARRAFAARMKGLAVESRVNAPKPAAVKPQQQGLGVDPKNTGDIPF